MALSLRQEEWTERQCGRSEGCSCTSRDREEGGRDNKTLQTEENKLSLCFLRVVSNYTCVCVCGGERGGGVGGGAPEECDREKVWD